MAGSFAQLPRHARHAHFEDVEPGTDARIWHCPPREQISRGVFKVNPGSLLTALQRLERAGLLDAEWRQTTNSRRAKFYTLTRAGTKRLEVETADWTRRASAIARLLRTEG
jgi:DNA-binding PadR family transcriptional regulator